MVAIRRTVRVDREYPHPPKLVWRALTDPKLLSRWLMPNDFEPIVGHEFQFTTEPAPGFDGIVHCRVLEIAVREKLSFTWVGGPLDTVITFALEPTDKGTRLRVIHDGFEGLPGVLTSFILGAGNRKIYGRYLPEILDRMAAAGLDANDPDLSEVIFSEQDEDPACADGAAGRLTQSITKILPSSSEDEPGNKGEDR